MSGEYLDGGYAAEVPPMIAVRCRE